MAKARSPQYPQIGLRDAVEKVAAVYGSDYQNPIPRVVAAQHMGYQSLNGKSLGVLSATVKYGLLEGRGDETRVSDLAVQIIAHAPGTPERGEAIKRAAMAPDLFVELEARFLGGKASDQALRSYLLTQKFIPSAADSAIRAYRETKQFVEEEGRGYSGLELEPKQDVMNTTITPSTGPASLGGETKRSITHSSSDREINNIRVSKDCAIRLIADGPYNKRSIEALVKNLQLQLELGTYDEEEPPTRSN
jgi:hypothetical protein